MGPQLVQGLHEQFQWNSGGMNNGSQLFFVGYVTKQTVFQELVVSADAIVMKENGIHLSGSRHCNCLLSGKQCQGCSSRLPPPYLFQRQGIWLQNQSCPPEESHVTLSLYVC